MKKWFVRFGSLLVFNIVVLLVVGWLTPARVGWAALWAGLVLTAIVMWIKPLVEKWFRSIAAKSAHRRSKAGELLVELVLAFAVALVVWIATVVFTGVSIGGGIFGAFWGWVIPPVILLIGWAVYGAIDDRVEAHAEALADKVTDERRVPTPTPGAADASPGASGRVGRASAAPAPNADPLGTYPGGSVPPVPPVPQAPGAAAADTGRRRRDDGLTDEQRRMLDELG